MELAHSGRFADAERELQDAVALQPEVATFQAQLGSVLGLEGKLADAAISFSNAVLLEPQNPDFRRELAAVQWQLGKLVEAEKNLRLLLQNHPRDDSAIMLLGMVRESEKGFQEAAQLLSSEMNLVSSHPDRVLALVHSYYGSGDPERARQVASLLIQNASNAAWQQSLYAGAHMAIQAQDWEQAGRLLQALPPQSHNLHRYQLELANLDYHRGNFGACVERLTHLKQAAPEEKWTDGLLGKCYVEQKDYRSAIGYLKQAIDNDPADLTNYANLLAAYGETGNLSSALALASRAVTNYPDRTDSWTLMGTAQIESGHFLDAIQSCRHALSLDPSNAEATIGLGNAQLLGGQLADARATYEKAILSFPDNPRFYVGYATALTHSSDMPRADVNPKVESLLRKAIELDTSLAAAHYLLGQTLLDEGQIKESVEQLEVATRQDPASARTHYALQRAYRRLGRSEDAAREFELFRQLKGDEDNDPMSNQPSQ